MLTHPSLLLITLTVLGLGSAEVLGQTKKTTTTSKSSAKAAKQKKNISNRKTNRTQNTQVKQLLDRSSRGVTTRVDRARRIESFQDLGLLQLTYIELWEQAKTNPSTKELHELGELALVLGRLEDSGRLFTVLRNRKMSVSQMPAAFRAAVTGFYLEVGNTSAALAVVPPISHIQNFHPRARVKAASVIASAHLFENNSVMAINRSLAALGGANPVKDTDFSLLYLQRARILYEQGNLSQAMEELMNIPRISPAWYPGLMVSAWSSYRAGDLNLSLGLLLSMHSPYLQDKFNPESYILEASTLYRMCHYESALRSLNTFKNRYRSVAAAISRIEGQLNSRLDTVDSIVEFANRYLEGHVSETGFGFDETTSKLVMDGILAEPIMAEVALSLEHVEKAENYLRSIEKDGDSPFLRGTLRTYAKELERAKIQTQQRARKFMISRLRHMREMVSEATENTLAIEVEVNTRIRERLIAGQLPRSRDIEFDADLKRGFEFWPFQNEYWRDEAGSYVFATTDVCAGEQAGLR